MKPLYLEMNLGLGDAIICNGLVRSLAQRKPGCAPREVVLPCWAHNRPTVVHMFSDLPNVRVVSPINGDGPVPAGHSGYEILSISVNNPRFGSVEPWDASFYEFAKVPFDEKWRLFHVPDSASRIDPKTVQRPFAVIHDDQGRGFEIDYARTSLLGGDLWFVPVNKVRAPLLTDWRDLIHDAAEVHCIDSSVLHLAELLPTTGKLFYHKYARAKGNRHHTDAVLRKDWTVLE